MNTPLALSKIPRPAHTATLLPGALVQTPEILETPEIPETLEIRATLEIQETREILDSHVEQVEEVAVIAKEIRNQVVMRLQVLFLLFLWWLYLSLHKCKYS